MSRKVQFAETVVVGDSAEPAPKELNDLTSATKRKKRNPTPFPASGGPAATTMTGRSLSLMSELSIQPNAVKVKTQTVWVEEAEANQAGAEIHPYEHGDRFLFESSRKAVLFWRVIVLAGAWFACPAPRLCGWSMWPWPALPSPRCKQSCLPRFSVFYAPYEAAFHGILENDTILLPIRCCGTHAGPRCASCAALAVACTDAMACRTCAKECGWAEPPLRACLRCHVHSGRYS